VRVEKKRQSRAQDKDYTYCGQSEEVESWKDPTKPEKVVFI
jgi:hypothetical protein